MATYTSTGTDSQVQYASVVWLVGPDPLWAATVGFTSQEVQRTSTIAVRSITAVGRTNISTGDTETVWAAGPDSVWAAPSWPSMSVFARQSVQFSPSYSGGARDVDTMSKDTEVVWNQGPTTLWSKAVSYEDEDQVERAAIIPAGYLRTLTGTVKDEDGNSINTAVYIIAIGDLNLVGPVDNQGNFKIRLLKQTYSEFQLITDSDDEEYDFVWYETEGNPDVGSAQNTVDLQFKRADATAGGLRQGLSISGDVSFG